MKKYILRLLLIGILSLFGCSKSDNDRRIEFWTDNDLSNTAFNNLFIDENLIGTLTKSVNMTNCGNDANIEFSFPTNSVFKVSIRSDNGDIILFGNIGLGDFDSGLSIDRTNATTATTLSVDGTSSNSCTRVYLSWQ